MNSLEHFGTVAFEMSMMREHIHVSREDPSRLEVSRWLSIVPEVYRRSIVPLVRRAFESVRYEKSRDASIYNFLTALHGLIWKEIKPIAPAETERWRLDLAQEMISKALAGEATITQVDIGFDDNYRGVTRLTFDDNTVAGWADLEFAERMATYWGARLAQIEGREPYVRHGIDLESRHLESALVDALEEELKNYQFAPKSWPAVKAVITALRTRDEKIGAMKPVVEAALAYADDGDRATFVAALEKFETVERKDYR